ncbi:MAG: HDOD domain-containing protein [Oligoflexales bacterium]|nr:HDOD domain-containing protein [Oligoflexales bacterium]
MVYKKCKSCGREYSKEEDFLTDTSRWRVCDYGMLWFNCSCDSTLMIPKGKFDWYSPDKILSPYAGKVFNKLLTLKTDIPMMPSAAMEAQSLLQDEHTSMKDLSEAIRKMPHLAIEIIKIADNMRVGRNRIETLEHACVYVGRKKVAEIINLACIKNFEFNTKLYGEQKFWEESFLTGLIAEKLATRFLGQDHKDLAYLAGSFANIGKILLSILLPSKADAIHKQVSVPKEVNTWVQAERDLKVVNHTILGEIACRIWGLPDYIVESVVKHHGKTQGHSEKFKDIANIVALSNQIMHWVSLNPSRIEQDLMEHISKTLGMEKDELEKFCEESMQLAEKATDLGNSK